MFIELISGMNIPGKDGNITPAQAGDVVDVPERFALQQISEGRASKFVEQKEIAVPEGDVTAKISKR